MTTGNIGVKTENIFPVIKKFLYSDQEIFLREIISNALSSRSSSIRTRRSSCAKSSATLWTPPKS